MNELAREGRANCERRQEYVGARTTFSAWEDVLKDLAVCTKDQETRYGCLHIFETKERRRLARVLVSDDMDVVHES